MLAFVPPADAQEWCFAHSPESSYICYSLDLNPDRELAGLTPNGPAIGAIYEITYEFLGVEVDLVTYATSPTLACPLGSGGILSCTVTGSTPVFVASVDGDVVCTQAGRLSFHVTTNPNLGVSNVPIVLAGTC
jgi:hypothetical protein